MNTPTLEIPTIIPVTADLEHAVYRMADERVEVRPAEGTVYVDGELNRHIKGRQFQTLDVFARQAGTILTAPEVAVDVWGDDSKSALASFGVALMNLRKGLGVELGDPEDGVIRTRPGFGYWGARSLVPGVIPPVEDESPVRTIADGRIAVYTEQLTLARDGEHIEDLSKTEYELIAELARRPERTIGFSPLRTIAGVLSKESLMMHISNLRKKLGRDDLGHVKYGAIRTNQTGYLAKASLQAA